jgi:hypothetical protein
VTVGEYDCEPFMATATPFIVTDVAFVVDHVNVTDWPLVIVADGGVNVAVGIATGGGAGAFTVTVDVSCAEPAELLATRVYVVVTVGEYDCDPFAATVTPLIFTDVAFVVAHVSVTDWPLVIVADGGVNDAVGMLTVGGGGAVPDTVTVTLAESR